MTKTRYARTTLALSLIAAALAFSAALFRYVKTGELKLPIIAAGIFLLIFGFGVWSRKTPEK